MIQKSKSKILKTVLSAVWWTLTVLLVLLLVTIVCAKLQNKVPKLFGHSVMRIVTGSMEPEITADDYILIRDCKPEDIKAGDIISFYSSDPDILGMPNTHRVAGEPILTENGLEFVTRGDANPENDAYRVTEDRIIGRYVGKLGILNALGNLFEGRAMLILLLILQFATVGIFFVSLFKKDMDENGKDPDKIRAELEEKLKADAIAEYIASQNKTEDAEDKK